MFQVDTLRHRQVRWLPTTVCSVAELDILVVISKLLESHIICLLNHRAFWYFQSHSQVLSEDGARDYM